MRAKDFISDEKIRIMRTVTSIHFRLKTFSKKCSLLDPLDIRLYYNFLKNENMSKSLFEIMINDGKVMWLRFTAMENQKTKIHSEQISITGLGLTNQSFSNSKASDLLKM